MLLIAIIVYLCYVWSHGICTLEQITVGKEKGFICVRETTLPTHSVKRVIDFICTLSVAES